MDITFKNWGFCGKKKKKKKKKKTSVHGLKNLASNALKIKIDSKNYE